MSKIQTPAMYEIGMGYEDLLPSEAKLFAVQYLMQQGIDPSAAEIDPEIRRQRYVAARNFCIESMGIIWPSLLANKVVIDLPPAVINVAPMYISKEAFEVEQPQAPEEPTA